MQVFEGVKEGVAGLYLRLKARLVPVVAKKAKGRTIEVRVFLGYLCNLSLEANNSFAIPIVAHDGGSNESSSIMITNQMVSNSNLL